MKLKGNKTINHLAIRNNIKNPSRSLLMIAVIILSTMLLTAISSYAAGLMEYEKTNAEYNYGRFYGMFTDATPANLKAIAENTAFEETGLVYDCGIIENQARINMKYLDENACSLFGMDLRITDGSYPQKENEILVNKGMLKACGYDGKTIGDTITLSIRTDKAQAYYEKEFIISGFVSSGSEEGDADAYGAFVSGEFQKNICGDSVNPDILFRLSTDIAIDYENADAVIQDYGKACGFEKIQINTNSLYILMAVNPGNELLLVCGLLIVLVVLFSMIVIYNIFQISLVQRMQEYGRLKAIGSTRAQMKRLINREGMMLAVPAVPVGAVLGYAAAVISFRWLVKTTNMIHSSEMNSYSFFSPIAVFGSIAVAFLTVYLALIKPKRTISRISPLEAISYREELGASGAGKRNSRASGLRKGHQHADEKTIAFSNLSSGKKQTITTMLTLGLSCVLLVVCMNCLGNIDVEYEAKKSVMHGQFQIDLDYTFYDEVYQEDNLDNILGNNPMNEEFLEELRSIKGVTDVSTKDCLVIKRGIQLDAVSVLSKEDFEFEKNKGGATGELDYDKASAEDQLLYGWSYFLEDNDINIGDRLDCSLWDGKACQEHSLTLAGSFGSLSGGWAITEETYRHFGYTPGSNIGTIWVDCSEKDRAYVEEQIRELMSAREHMDLETLEKNLEEQAFGSRVIRLAVYSLLIIIGFIGFMNMANTMIISITTRRREYGIMQAVGMTGRQMAKSLILQGMVFAGGTLVVSIAAGLPLGYLAFKKFKNISGFGMNVYHLPLIELIIMTAVLILLQLALSGLLSKNLKKDSLVERIRY